MWDCASTGLFCFIFVFNFISTRTSLGPIISTKIRSTTIQRITKRALFRTRIVCTCPSMIILWIRTIFAGDACIDFGCHSVALCHSGLLIKEPLIHLFRVFCWFNCIAHWSQIFAITLRMLTLLNTSWEWHLITLCWAKVTGLIWFVKSLISAKCSRSSR